MRSSPLRPLLLAALSLAGGACAPRERAGPPVSEIDSLFVAFAKPGRPGASLLVVSHDSTTLRKSYGLSDVEAGTPATPATNYRLASLTKQFTAMSIMLLVREGKLTLDTPVSQLLDGFPPYAAGVHVRHLLTHTSGLWDYEDFVPDTQRTQVHDADALSLLRARTDSTYFPPGTAWRYSNTGYALLALIVEKVSGMRFADFLKTRIFDAVGMPNTVAFEDGRSTVSRRAFGYTVHGDSVTRSDQSSTSAVLGDGGIYSSVEDMAKWEGAIRSGALVDSATWKATFTPFALSNGSSSGYGFGWFIDDFQGHRRYRHHGETMGFTNSIMRFPDDSLTIVILTNRSDSAPWTIAERVAALYLAK
jgi:CubicO group peptidase (beta-lactamase class C family)